MTDARGQLFSDPFHNEFGTWMLGYTPYGGGDYGDVAAVAAAVGDGDDGAFYDAWMAAGDRMRAEADSTLAAGHRESASDLYLRASAAYASAYHPLYGAPVDPRLLEGYRRQVAAFDAGMGLREVPVEAVEIPLEGARMRSYLVPAAGRETEVRPLVILVNGYDATVTDLWFAMGVAASRRGYHVLMFDGPGQGGMLYEQGVPLRHDWEVVVSAVVDHALTFPIVDAARIAVSGWSLGGYLAPRAASGEPRISACIADPGQWDLGASLVSFAERFGATAEEAAHPETLDDAALEQMMSVIRQNRTMRWSIEQRGFWANGVTDLRGLIAATSRFTLRDRVAELRCPVLLTRAENDPLAAAVGDFAAALPSATVIDFSAAEGAGTHCEMMNRSLVNRRALDWLDTVFGVESA
ncbi:alpha/beta hydrolase family protein [Herbiconiux sp. P16]|uniref:alpha/beta hydrolase n=1 Tax=Herbiconiux wuyangfengii TaxID=3342794 RepID=UPI0035B72DE5